MVKPHDLAAGHSPTVAAKGRNGGQGGDGTPLARCDGFGDLSDNRGGKARVIAAMTAARQSEFTVPLFLGRVREMPDAGCRMPDAGRLRGLEKKRYQAKSWATWGFCMSSCHDPLLSWWHVHDVAAARGGDAELHRVLRRGAAVGCRRVESGEPCRGDQEHGCLHRGACRSSRRGLRSLGPKAGTKSPAHHPQLGSPAPPWVRPWGRWRRRADSRAAGGEAGGERRSALGAADRGHRRGSQGRSLL